jgi:hypothetical protein
MFAKFIICEKVLQQQLPQHQPTQQQSDCQANAKKESQVNAKKKESQDCQSEQRERQVIAKVNVANAK